MLDRGADILKTKVSNPRFCYWSVCDGPYAALMENCVASAREVGVKEEFHVLTDRPIEGGECYDCYEFDKAHGLFKLHYLKVGMTRLKFDYFVWIDADSIFVRHPGNPLDALRLSPIHVPLELNLDQLQKDRQWSGVSLFALREFSKSRGIANQVHLNGSAFWIVHQDAIEQVYELALGFWGTGKEQGLLLDVSAALGYAMQMLCADPDAHRLDESPDLWCHTTDEVAVEDLIKDEPWIWQHPLGGDPASVRPAIVHNPVSAPKQPAVQAG